MFIEQESEARADADKLAGGDSVASRGDRKKISRDAAALLYVPERVMGIPQRRACAVLLLVSRDVPSCVWLTRIRVNCLFTLCRARHATRFIVPSVVDAMPELYERLGEQYSIGSIDAIQDVLYRGRSPILRVCIGAAAVTRNAFLGDLAALLSALSPRPRVVLVRGHDRNRCAMWAHVAHCMTTSAAQSRWRR